MGAPMTPDQRAAALFANQYGAIGLGQARATGLSDDQIEYRRRTGRWIRPVHGVYVLAGTPGTPEQRAMVAFLATQAAGGIVSYLTAAAIFGLTRFPLLPHVTVPRNASHDCRAAKVHRGSIPFIDRARRDGFGLTSVSRTLADCASIVDRPCLEELVDAAFCRRMATKDSTLAAAARAGAGRQGNPLLREVAHIWSPRIEPGSVAEMRLLRQLAERGAGNVVTQHNVYGDGGVFIARLDVACPEIRCGLEYDGVEAHNPRLWNRDEQRYERLRAARWTIDSVSKLDLLPGEPRLDQIIARWHRRRAA